MTTPRHVHIVLSEWPGMAGTGQSYSPLFRMLQQWSALHISVHLHAFSDQQETISPTPLCSPVRLYPLRRGHHAISPALPFCVSERMNDDLVQQLRSDNEPILLLGLGATAVLDALEKEDRKIFLLLDRMEHQYYQHLKQFYRSPIRRALCSATARKLKAYEQKMAEQVPVIAISDSVYRWYGQQPAGSVQQVNWPLPANAVRGNPGSGSFCLLYGDLSGPQQEAGIRWLLRNVFYDKNIPLVVAGWHPSRKLQSLIHQKKHCCLVTDPDTGEITDLLRKAHISLLSPLPSAFGFWSMLPALCEGRHFLAPGWVDIPAAFGQTCHQAQDAASYRNKLEWLYRQPFSQQELETRRALFAEADSGFGQTQKLVNLIFS